MLKGKNVVLGITGCIAAYKACEIVSRLKKLGANVDVIMTKNATEFVQPLTFETLSNNPCITDMFKREKEWEVEHVSLAKKADVFVIAPATANIIGKMAQGICDDMLSTTVLATKAPILVAPAMNTNMYTNEQFFENLSTLKNRGVKVVNAVEGRLACGDVGKGKMAEPIDIVNEIVSIILPEQTLKGKNALVTLGSTREKIDPVRFISNNSSGKMGLAVARELAKRGANVTIVAGYYTVNIDQYFKVIPCETTMEMYEACMKELNNNDIIVKCAAPCDYKVNNYQDSKIKEDNVSIELSKTVDIAEELGKKKGDKKLIVFAAETENLIENAKKKLIKKNADMVVANDVTVENAGFNSESNKATLIFKDGKMIETELVSKSNLAKIIVDNI